MIKAVLWVCLALLTVISIGSLFWRSYPLELFSHFRVYYLLSAGGIAIVSAIGYIRKWRTQLLLYLALGLVAFNSAWIIPWYLPHSQQGSSRSIRVLTFNINVANDQWDAIANSIQTVKPDIAAIQESSPEAKTELSARLSPILPFSYRTSGGGLTILSRFPLISPQRKAFKNGSALITFLKVNQKIVEVISVHPSVPVKPGAFKQRNAFLAELGTYLLQSQQTQSLKTPRILLGDFNLTPWSPYYSELLQSTDLHNTRFGFGIEPSWIEPATHVHHPNWITALVKIPIDHIFVTSDFKVSDCQTRQAANSDHRMLWSDLSF